MVPFLFHSNQVWWLLGFMTLSTVVGAVANPAWGSMMSDLVPVRLRGKYFGTRGMINGLTMLVFSFIASGILTAFDQAGNFTGYVIIFIAAMVFRLTSWFFLTKQYEPVQKASKNDSPGMVTLFRQVGSTSLGKFICILYSLIFVLPYPAHTSLFTCCTILTSVISRLPWSLAPGRYPT